MQQALDKVLRANGSTSSISNSLSSATATCGRRRPAQKIPVVVVDSHNIDYDLARQYTRTGGSLLRRLYAEANWRKLRREELGTYGRADGVYLCSVADQQRLLDDIPAARTMVIPNAADVDFYKPRPTIRDRMAAPSCSSG